MKTSSLKSSRSHQIGISLIALSQIVLMNVAFAQAVPPAQTTTPVEARQNANRNADRLSKARKQLQEAFPTHRHNMKDQAIRAELVRRLRECEEEHMAAVRERAELKGLELKGDTPNGGNFILIDFDENDQPVYEETQNINAAITATVNEVRDNPIFQQQAAALVEAEVAFPDNHNGIRVETTTDTGGGQNIGFINNGDWAEYTIDVPAPGSYRFTFRTASNNNDGGTINLSSDGSSIGSVVVPDTNGWQSWITIGTQVAFATSGSKTLRLDFAGGSGSLFNINWFTYGRSVLIGQWESETARLTHQELEGRISNWDSSATSTGSHATHVAGIMISRGINPEITGMAPQASIAAFSSQGGAESEMLANGAAAPNTTDIYLSNHSYGTSRGWRETNGVWSYRGSFFDDDDPSNDNVQDFGRYSLRSRQWDNVAYNLPYYLIFTSSGNQRLDDAPDEGEAWFFGSTEYIYDSSQHPLSNLDTKNGWDNMEGGTLAKNAIAVGASHDGVDSNGNRDLSQAEAGFFSARGPADDGRIKPDIHGNGITLLSSSSSNDSSTRTLTGTSQSSPNVCGSAALLIGYYSSRFPGEAMRASTLKALILHTADDLGVPGPDYSYGWGMMNTKAAADVIKQHADGNGGAFMLESSLDESANTSRTHSFTSDGTTPLRVSLCWTDPPGSQKVTGHDNRSQDLVNDLNLKITGPDGTHLPYVMPYVGDWSLEKIDDPAITGVNNVDPIEQVYLVAPAAGDYTITVDYAGSSLIGDMQEYSLVVTGQAPAQTEAEIEVVYDGPPASALSDNSGVQNFGATAPSGASVVRSYTIRNSGESPLTGLAITTSGSDTEDFTVGSISSTELAAGQTASFTVTYNPLGTGPRTATLHLVSNDADESTFNLNLVATGLSELEAWRLTNFNTTEGTGDDADLLDFDKDGASNLAEFLLATDPTKPDSGPLTFTTDGNTTELIYTRNVNAIADYTFQVTWSENLTQDTWLANSVTEEILSTEGSVQRVKATVPVGSSIKRFFRVQVSPK